MPLKCTVKQLHWTPLMLSTLLTGIQYPLYQYYIYTGISLYRAAALMKINKYDQALSDCQDAVKLDPSYAKVHCRMG